MTESQNQQVNKLPWWTWVLPLILIHLGTQVSLWSNVYVGSSLFYFPVPIALILTYWWGPRVLLSLYVNALLSAGLWGLGNVLYYPLYALPEVIFVALSWLFFIRLADGKCWLPNIRELGYFLAVGLVVPLVLYKFILEGLFLLAGEISLQDFWLLLITTGLGDFISMFGLCIPVLYLATGKISRLRLTYFVAPIPKRINTLRSKIKLRDTRIEITICCLVTIVLSRLVAFSDYWFLYGILCLYVAIRYGFGFVIVFNSFILLLTYVVPALLHPSFTEELIMDKWMIQTQLGSGLLYVFGTVTGRVMSDAGALEKQLSLQNKELEQANKELDRFVYSVSHDLSAPLRSIMGLVNISRLDSNEQMLRGYINNIETSVLKLENFINEILEYSRNERQEILLEEIDLAQMCNEILDNLKYQERFSDIQIDLSGIGIEPIRSDKMRLKIILNNLLSNAIKFQAGIWMDEKPFIRVSQKNNADYTIIEVEDNGEGIKPEAQGRIFEMFYRGTNRSNGSGLGLYIAKEAAEKIDGSIVVDSTYGKGTLFRVSLKR